MRKLLLQYCGYDVRNLNNFDSLSLGMFMCKLNFYLFFYLEATVIHFYSMSACMGMHIVSNSWFLIFVFINSYELVVILIAVICVSLVIYFSIWWISSCWYWCVRHSSNMLVVSYVTFSQAEWMAPEVLRNEPSDEKYVSSFLMCQPKSLVLF